MKRREFITLVSGAAVAWPLASRAQQPVLPVVGFLSGGSQGSVAHLVAEFAQGLKESGYVEGQNLTIEYRYANGQYDRLPTPATELLGRGAGVLVSSGPQAALAAKAATTTVPVLFVVAVDPVTTGLVLSLNRPGGNVTGMTFMARALAAKRLELLHELIPNATVISMLGNPNNPTAEADIGQVQAAARSLGLQVDIVNASTERDLTSIFATLNRRRLGALFVSGNPFFFSRRDQLGALSARHAIAATYDRREFVVAGGDELRRCGLCRRVPAGRHLREQDTQRCEAGRIARHAVHQIRVRDQRQECEGSRA